MAGMEGLESRFSTPRFHDCEHSPHRKVALRTVTGSSHPECAFERTKRSILSHVKTGHKDRALRGWVYGTVI